MKKYIDCNTEKRTNTANSLKKIFSNWWSILFMGKQLKIYEKQCQASKQRKRFFKIY